MQVLKYDIPYEIENEVKILKQGSKISLFKFIIF